MLVGLALAAPAASLAGEPAFPGAHWETREPAELGLDPAALDALAAELGGRGCVIKDGYVVKSWGDQAKKSDWYSSVKPVFSTLLFFAIEEGKVAGVDAPVAAFGWDLGPKDSAITFRHLADMTSGYARPEPPGAAFSYNDYAIQLYQLTLFDRVFKADPAAVVADPARLGPLGFEDGLDFSRKRRLKASVRDFARIAWFWAQRGRWGDRQLLPRRYFDEYMRPDVAADLPLTADVLTNDHLRIGTFGGGSNHFTKFGAGIYGFNWWFNARGLLHPDTPTWPDAPADTVMSIGFGGNCTALIPSLGLALVCAEGSWGSMDAGNPRALQNLRLKRLAESARR